MNAFKFVMFTRIAHSTCIIRCECCCILLHKYNVCYWLFLMFIVCVYIYALILATFINLEDKILRLLNVHIFILNVHCVGMSLQPI